MRFGWVVLLVVTGCASAADEEASSTQGALEKTSACRGLVQRYVDHGVIRDAAGAIDACQSSFDASSIEDFADFETCVDRYVAYIRSKMGAIPTPTTFFSNGYCRDGETPPDPVSPEEAQTETHAL